MTGGIDPILVKVSRLVEITNIPQCNIWGCGKISFFEISNFIKNNIMREEASTAITKKQNIARIAYLVVNGWNDPIDIDVGVPILGCYVRHIVGDGNHRLFAAAYRGDEYISANISGCVETAKEMLGVDI